MYIVVHAHPHGKCALHKEMKLKTRTQTENCLILLLVVLYCYVCARQRYWIFTSDVYIYDGVKLELHADSGTTVRTLLLVLKAHQKSP